MYVTLTSPMYDRSNHVFRVKVDASGCTDYLIANESLGFTLGFVKETPNEKLEARNLVLTETSFNILNRANCGATSMRR